MVVVMARHNVVADQLAHPDAHLPGNPKHSCSGSSVQDMLAVQAFLREKSAFGGSDIHTGRFGVVGTHDFEVMEC